MWWRPSSDPKLEPARERSLPPALAELRLPAPPARDGIFAADGGTGKGEGYAVALAGSASKSLSSGSGLPLVSGLRARPMNPRT